MQTNASNSVPLKFALDGQTSGESHTGHAVSPDLSCSCLNIVETVDCGWLIVTIPHHFVTLPVGLMQGKCRFSFWLY